MNIKIVHDDDWDGLYVDNLLYREDHRITPSDICSAIMKYGGMIEFSYDEKWKGGYPLYYNELINNNKNNDGD